MGGAWVDGPDQRGRRYVISTSLDLDHLANKKFDKTILAELRALPLVPDLKFLTREYITSIGRVHDQLRIVLKPVIDDWRAHFETTIALVRSSIAEDTRFLAVFRQEADGTRTKLLDVFDEPLKRLADMQQLNKTKLNLGPAFASSEALPPHRR
jgi:hypothetical protein